MLLVLWLLEPACPKPMPQRCIDALLELACDEVANGGEINLTGYMKISTVQRAARMGRNPQTGESVSVPASTGVKIQAGARLKSAARG